MWRTRLFLLAVAGIGGLFTAWLQMVLSWSVDSERSTAIRFWAPDVLSWQAWCVSPVILAVGLAIARPPLRTAVMAALVFVVLNAVAVVILIPAASVVLHSLSGL